MKDKIISIVPIEVKYVEDALRLAQQEYETERKVNTQLPDRYNIDALREMITYLFGLKHGVVALEEGQLVGYLAFFAPLEDHFGHCKGAFCPLGGSAFTGSNRGKLASRMLVAAMVQLVREEQVTGYSLSRYANDKEVGESLVLNGFGIRCSDGIRCLSGQKMEVSSYPKIQLKELVGEEHLMNWYSNDEIRVFAAYDREEAIGFMAITGESILQTILIVITEEWMRESWSEFA